MSLVSSPTFSLFPYLPQEIKIHIWREFILTFSQSRLVLIDKESRRIVPTPFLSLPPLSVNSLSRLIAKTLYPIQLPVFYIPRCKEEAADEVTGIEQEIEHVGDLNCLPACCSTKHGMIRRDSKSNHQTCGALYLSFEYDNFHVQRTVSDTTRFWSAPLTPEQCQRVHHLVEVEWISRLKYSLTSYPSLPIDSDMLRLRQWYDTKTFGNVKTCEYNFLDSDRLPSSYDFLHDLHQQPWREVLSRWRLASVLFNEGKTTKAELSILASLSHNGTFLGSF
ncbi:hypothetical protein F4818DRAFT_423763 [Hypoxylon cercidicola]|nr:hypothetical protein F4818DRAFT_423763 [Hypoxylon cercidicola]